MSQTLSGSTVFYSDYDKQTNAAPQPSNVCILTPESITSHSKRNFVNIIGLGALRR
jgi:hypothetical protein